MQNLLIENDFEIKEISIKELPKNLEYYCYVGETLKAVLASYLKITGRKPVVIYVVPAFDTIYIPRDINVKKEE